MHWLSLMLVICLPSLAWASWFSTVSEKFVNGFHRLLCPSGDCCRDPWMANITKLQYLLDDEVFGQHIATEIVSKQVEAHLTTKNPTKPLVMSFHGWTGNGKNHVAHLVGQSLFHHGVKSQFYHHYMATVHFPNEELSPIYQDQLRNWIKGNVTACPRSLFIFDEVDKIPEGVLDGIRAYLDYNHYIDGVDYRNAIFIFLSNTGGKEIINQVKKNWELGKKREELTIKDFERLVEVGAFNEEGGLYQAFIIEKHLIDLYVPFLPLEKRHVRLCTRTAFRNERYLPDNMEEAVEEVVNSLNYYPENLQLYSMTGCKRVTQKVRLFIARDKTKKFHQKRNEL